MPVFFHSISSLTSALWGSICIWRMNFNWCNENMKLWSCYIHRLTITHNQVGSWIGAQQLMVTEYPSRLNLLTLPWTWAWTTLTSALNHCATAVLLVNEINKEHLLKWYSFNVFIATSTSLYSMDTKLLTDLFLCKPFHNIKTVKYSQLKNDT